MTDWIRFSSSELPRSLVEAANLLRDSKTRSAALEAIAYSNPSLTGISREEAIAYHQLQLAKLGHISPNNTPIN